MDTRGAKAKGRSLQNRVAKDLAKITGLTYGSPNDDQADLRGRLMGTPGADIVRSKDAMGLVPFYAECKNSESWSFGKRMFEDGLGQLVRWYLDNCAKAQAMGIASLNIPILIAAKAHTSPVVLIAEHKYTLSSRWNTDSVILMRIPLTRFLVKDADHHVVTGGSAVNILSWADFLRIWYGKA